VIDGTNEYVLQWAILPVSYESTRLGAVQTLRQVVLEANLNSSVADSCYLHLACEWAFPGTRFGRLKTSWRALLTMSAADNVVRNLTGE